MPLLDHFHPPLSERRHWEAFHARWAAAIADGLNEQLPEDYFAEAQVHHGARVEIDVGSFRDPGSGGTAVQAPPKPVLVPADLVIPAIFPEEFAVRIFETSGGPSLVAAIELVSPANQDRDDHRCAFAVKCAAYLQQGMGLIVVDVVTNRHPSPLQDLLHLLKWQDRAASTAHALAAVSYRPKREGDAGLIELRVRPLAVGQPLPTLPLALDAGQVVSVDFEAAYQEARSRSRL